MTASTKGSGFAEDQVDFAVEPPTTLDPPRWLEKHELEAIGCKADAWLEANKQIVDALPTGTVVMINIGTGEYETGPDHEAARLRFDRRFGATTIGHVHRVRMPTTIGGGWWALHSEV